MTKAVGQGLAAQREAGSSEGGADLGEGDGLARAVKDHKGGVAEIPST